MAGLWQQLLRLTSDPPELSRHAHTDCHVLPYPAFTFYSAVQHLVRYGGGAQAARLLGSHSPNWGGLEDGGTLAPLDGGTLASLDGGDLSPD